MSRATIKRRLDQTLTTRTNSNKKIRFENIVLWYVTFHYLTHIMYSSMLNVNHATTHDRECRRATHIIPVLRINTLTPYTETASGFWNNPIIGYAQRSAHFCLCDPPYWPVPAYNIWIIRTKHTLCAGNSPHHIRLTVYVKRTTVYVTTISCQWSLCFAHRTVHKLYTEVYAGAYKWTPKKGRRKCAGTHRRSIYGYT